MFPDQNERCLHSLIGFFYRRKGLFIYTVPPGTVTIHQRCGVICFNSGCKSRFHAHRRSIRYEPRLLMQDGSSGIAWLRVTKTIAGSTREIIGFFPSLSLVLHMQ